MPTIEELRQAWPKADYVTDDLLQSPWFHVGVLKTGLAQGDRLRLSVAVLADALAAAQEADNS